MNEEENKNQLKMNMASHDFYSSKTLEAESELLELLDTLEDRDVLDERLGKKIILKGMAYLNLSSKFQQELDRMEQLAPNLQKTMFGEGGDKEMFEFYVHNLEEVRAAQRIVHTTLEDKIKLIEKLINENGYGSYE